MTSTLPEAPPNLKLLLIGNSSVGKSSLLTRFTDASFTPEDESSATIGVDFRVCKMEVKGKKVKLSIWVRACTPVFGPPLKNWACRTQQVRISHRRWCGAARWGSVAAHLSQMTRTGAVQNNNKLVLSRCTGHYPRLRHSQPGNV